MRKNSAHSFSRMLDKAAKRSFRIMVNVKNTKQVSTRKGRGIAVYLDVRG